MGTEYFRYDVEKIKLDSKDKKILELLYKNSRTPVSEIARKTGIPKDSVLYRVKRLEKLKAVTYITIINPVFIGFITTHPNIIYSAKTSGRYDYTIAISAKSLKHFDEIMKLLRTKFSDIIKDFETVDILEEYKYDYMVDLIDQMQ